MSVLGVLEENIDGKKSETSNNPRLGKKSETGKSETGKIRDWKSETGKIRDQKIRDQLYFV